MFQEISRRVVQLTKYEDTDIVWHNNVLTLRIDSGLHLFDYSYNLKCLDKRIDFIEAKVHTSKSSPASELFPESALKCQMRNLSLTQMIVDPALWPHNKCLMDVTITTVFDWSPVDFIHNNECVLATVNSAGNVDLHAQSRHKWTILENLSQKLKAEMTANSLIPSISCKGPLDVGKIKMAAYALETNSFCWAPMLNEDKSCYFVTAQKNGCILFWSLKWETSGINVKLLTNIVESKGEIITMKWIPSDKSFLIVCANTLGQILAYECQVTNNVLNHLTTHTLWGHKDRMVAYYMQYDIYNDHIFLACSKHRHFLLLMIDKSFRVSKQNVTNINDERITAIVKNGNDFYVSVVNRDIYRIKYFVENESLQVHLILLEMKAMSSTYELCSFAFSTNNTVLAVALLDRTVRCRKMPLKIEIVFYVREVHDKELPILMDNPTKTLSGFWDVIESLRCKTLKSRTLPTFDYNELYAKAKTDIYYSKVYLILLILYNSLEIAIINDSRGMLPETSVDFVKSKILANYAANLIISTLKILTPSQEVNDNTEKESILMAKAYIEEFCKKFDTKLSSLLPPNIIEMFPNNSYPTYTCQWCDETLQAFVCKNNHVNAFCSMSFTPIESDDYLICRSCGTTVRSDLSIDKPKCVFCDLYLCNCYLPS